MKRPAAATQSVALTTAKGLAIRVELTVENLVSLRHQTTAALRIEPTVVQDCDDEPMLPRIGRRLCEEDLAQIDQATLDFAARLLADGLAQPAIVVPVSFFTMASRKGRNALAAMAGRSPQVLKSRVMVEFVDVDCGTPISRLIEVGAMANSICRATLVRVTPAVDMLAAVRGYRPHGLTLDACDLADNDSQIAAQLLGFGDQAEGAAPLLVVQGLASDGFFQVAQVAGLTHAALRAPSPSRRKSAA